MDEKHREQRDNSESPRPLKPQEIAALRALLSHADFDGRDQLLAQVDAVEVVGRCGCGCATVELAVDTAPCADAASGPIPNEATVVSGDGDEIGGVLVFVKDGRLSELEVYSFGEDPINSLPPVERLRLDHLPRRQHA